MRNSNQQSDQRFLWRTGASPIKLRYLTQYASGSTALDIGSGQGFYTHHLRQQGFTVVAVDITRLLGNDVLFAQGRLKALPLAGNFDTVVCFDVLEHEEDEQQALNELRRLTRKRLLLSVPNADDKLLVPHNLTFKHHLDKTHVREYTHVRLRYLLEEAGFRIVVLQGEGPVRPEVFAEFIRPRWLRTPARLFIKILHRLHLLYNPALMADLYVVAEPNQ